MLVLLLLMGGIVAARPNYYLAMKGGIGNYYLAMTGGIAGYHV